MSLPYIQHRKQLVGLKQAINNSNVTFGFIGGSITDARPRHNWPQFFIEQFINQYPEVRCTVENAAIGATGSDLATFRVQRDLINRECNIVFIEFAVNDEDVEETRRFRSREGLIRQLLRAGITDIILVYTYSEKMKAAINSGQYPKSIAQFEKLADYYELPSIWVGKYGYDQVQAGRLSMNEWLPDGLHPQHEGSEIYAELVSTFLVDELKRVTNTEPNVSKNISVLKEPYDTLCWEKTESISFEKLKLKGRWQQYRWHDYEWIDRVLETTDPNAGFSFSFVGRGVVFVFDYGSQAYEFQYRINEGEWIYSNRDCPDWVGPEGWYRLFELETELPYSEYKVEVNIVEGERDKGLIKHFRLGKIGVIL